GGDDARFAEATYCLDAAGQFGSEGHHPEMLAPGGEQLVDVVVRRLAQGLWVVCPAARFRDERPFQMDPRECPFGNRLGQRGELLAQQRYRVGDQAGQHGGRAVRPMRSHRPQYLLRVGGRERRATSAVAVRVDEPGNHQRTVEVVLLDRGWWSRADLRDVFRVDM